MQPGITVEPAGDAEDCGQEGEGDNDEDSLPRIFVGELLHR